MAKSISKEKKVLFVRMIGCLLLGVSFFSFMYFGYETIHASLQDSLDANTSSYAHCNCPGEYTVSWPVRSASGSVSYELLVYELDEDGSNDDFCRYKRGEETLNVACNPMSAPASVMDKYVQAGILSAGQADTFISNASQSAVLAQRRLETITGTVFGGSESLGSNPLNSAIAAFNQNARFVYSFLIGFGFITSILVFILIFVKITWLPDFPTQRRMAMEDIVISGVATILLGGTWLLVSLFQSIFDTFWTTYAIYSSDWRTVGNMFLFEYRNLVIGVLGVAAITSVLMFIKNFIALSFCGDNPQERRQKLINILLAGIATAGLGGIMIFVSFFWNVLGASS